MKGTGRLVQLAVAIWDQDLTTGLTNQKLNAIIVKRQVIILGIDKIQPISWREYKSYDRGKERSHSTTSA
jgi:hypothetical protein